MSAAFKFRNRPFWGTNGAIEEYVAGLASAAAVAFGVDDALAVFFRKEHEGFFPGKVVFLDQCLEGPERLGQFIEILDATTVRILRDGVFTKLGEAWVHQVVAELREAVALAREREASR